MVQIYLLVTVVYFSSHHQLSVIQNHGHLTKCVAHIKDAPMTTFSILYSI